MSVFSVKYGWVLLLLLAVPAIIYYYLNAIKQKKASAMKFSSIGLIKEAAFSGKPNWRRHIQFILLCSAIILMVVGMADPQIPLMQTKEGVNVVLAVDVSGSMKATDYTPSRLEAAKKSAETLIKSLKPNDQVGIVLFGNGASTSSFLTPFKDKAIEKLRGIAPRDDATALGDGLALAVDMASSVPNKKKIIILLSDGVANAGAISPQEATSFAKANKIQVYTIGMGSNQRVVLGYDFFGNPQYADLDEAALKSIADSTSGKYYKSVDSSTLDSIYSTISQDIKRETEPTSIKDWFYMAAIALLLVLLYINYGRYKIVSLG